MSNAADRPRREQVTARLKRDAELDDEALQVVLRTPQGRRVCWRLLERSGLHQMSYAGEQTHVTAFNEGNRNQGQRLLADILRLDAACYLTMLRDYGQAPPEPHPTEESPDGGPAD